MKTLNTCPHLKWKWIGHTLEGNSLLRMVIERNGGEADIKKKAKTDDAVLGADRCIWKAYLKILSS